MACRDTQIQSICSQITNAMQSLIYGFRCASSSKGKLCDRAMLGALMRVMASQAVDDWFSCRMQGVENSITECLLKFSSLLSEIRSETANTSRCRDINQSHANCSPWAVGDENPGDKGTAFVHVLVSQFEGHLKEHAETSGLDPELPSVFTLRATYSTFFDQGPGGEKTQASRTDRRR